MATRPALMSLGRRLAVVATAAVVGVVGLVPAASAEPVPVSYVRLGPGYSTIYLDQNAGSYVFSIGGKEVTVYCADVSKEFNGSATFALQPLISAPVPRAPEAAWVVENAATVPTPDTDVNAEHAAIQVAVWHFTNGATVDATSVPYEPVRTRALALIAAATSQAVASGPTSFALTASGQAVGGMARITAKLTTDGGDPIVGETLSFSAGSSSGTAQTAADGTATWETALGGGVSVTVGWSGSVRAGSMLIPNDGSQPMILAESVPVERRATVQVAAPAATTTTAASKPAPTTQAPAKPAAPVTELPYTGSTLGVWHLLAAVAALGVAGVAVARLRRRV